MNVGGVDTRAAGERIERQARLQAEGAHRGAEGKRDRLGLQLHDAVLATATASLFH